MVRNPGGKNKLRVEVDGRNGKGLKGHVPELNAKQIRHKKEVYASEMKNFNAIIA